MLVLNYLVYLKKPDTLFTLQTGRILCYITEIACAFSLLLIFALEEKPVISSLLFAKAEKLQS